MTGRECFYNFVRETGLLEAGYTDFIDHPTSELFFKERKDNFGHNYYRDKYDKHMSMKTLLLSQSDSTPSSRKRKESTETPLSSKKQKVDSGSNNDNSDSHDEGDLC